jgi:choline dehydrogenase
MSETTFDFIVVGSGAGGGPLACNLARNGFKVGLVEAGRDPAFRDDKSTNFNYLVPALHGRATEDPDLSWNFFVQHYDDVARQKRNRKYFDPATMDGGVADALRTGILYPRAGTLGGCTAHNALITVYPHNEDWERIRALTDDDSWAADRMRSYFEKLEDCRYAPTSLNEARHGFGGWLPTSLADPFVAIGDSQLRMVAIAAVKAFLRRTVDSLSGANEIEKLRNLIKFLGPHLAMARSMQPRLAAPLQTALAAALGQIEQLNVILDQSSGDDAIASLLTSALIPGSSLQDAVEFLAHQVRLTELIPIILRHVDPNDWRVALNNLQGVYAVPLATNGVVRRGTREHVLNTQAEFPNRLCVLTDSLATRVVFDGSRAIGVEIIEGAFLYRASPRVDRNAPLPAGAAVRTLKAKREVILAGGAFNTPQLLMLSGIGSKAELDRHGIAPLQGKYWPGVGQNLHDRYEVGVISEMADDFELLSACPFKAPLDDGSNDACFMRWKTRESGAYTTNGVVLSVVLRSSTAESPSNDLFIFGLPGYFSGYHPQYSEELTKTKNAFTWAILKGHTRNRAGEVTLRSNDPRDPPIINFKYFDNGSAGHEQDLSAIVEAVRFVRDVMASTGRSTSTVVPDVSLNDDEQLRAFIADQAWGHHACGTCKIGRAGDENAVVDSRFRVHGVSNLRVVDASVFPDIPGFFIAAAIYMISEKASEVILSDALG